MEKEEIIEGDKLLSEFDGWKFIREVKLKKQTLPFYRKFNSEGRCIHSGIYEVPSYNKNWEGLMSVWFKFRDLKFKKTEDQIKHAHHQQEVSYAICYEEKNAAKKLAQAIKWYNSLKKTNTNDNN